jgi:hypothetical protein
LRDSVPSLTSLSALKAQFDWLTDGGVRTNIVDNLGPELINMELFLRYLKFNF